MDSDALHFHAVLSQAATDVEDMLESLLRGETSMLGAAMRYAVLSGGKRIRAFLALESSTLFHVPRPQALRAAAAVECIHAYSLVHDDLPCMDDDDMRRGKPTVHVKWDEATAVLTGDALQSFAFEILAAPQGGMDPRIQVRLLARLAQAAGIAGMAGGQAQDIAAATGASELNVQDITRMQALKTGALFGWAAEAGAILGRSDPKPMQRYAADLGLAFQIQDDILDVEGDAAALGKAVGKDSKAGKATFVSLLGLDGARKKARELSERACAHTEQYGSAAENLRRAARFAITRDG